MTFPGIQRLSAPPCPRLEPHGKKRPPVKPCPPPEGPTPVCVLSLSSVSSGGHGHAQDHDIPEIAESNLIMSFPLSSVSLHPSSSLCLQTELLLRMIDTDSLADGETGKLACRQTDTQGCAVFQSLTLLPHSESAFLNMNLVPWIQHPVSYSVLLVSKVLLSLRYD